MHTMTGAKTLTLDSKTNRILLIAAEYGLDRQEGVASGSDPFRFGKFPEVHRQSGTSAAAALDDVQWRAREVPSDSLRVSRGGAGSLPLHRGAWLSGAKVRT